VNEAGGRQQPGPLEMAVVTVVMAALTAVVTYPLARNAATALPWDLEDPLFGAFLIGWGASRMLFGFLGVWSAPFYFPLKGALAMAEHLLGVTVFMAPIVWLTGNPVLAHNLAFLGSYVLAGVGMYLLARSLWGRKDAAFLAALAFAFAPHRAMHYSHLQVLMSGWMPFSLWGLHQYFATGSRRALAVFAAALVLLSLSNGYYLYFFSLPVAVLVMTELAQAAGRGSGPRRFRIPWRTIADLALAAAAVLAVLAPVVLAYIRVRHALGLRRVTAEIAAFSAVPVDYVRIPPGAWLWSGIMLGQASERTLFPGLTVVLLAAIALLTARRSAWPASELRPEGWARHVGVYATVLVLALWLSGGPLVPGPYPLLLRILPGFDGLRVPARFIVIAALALALLGSAGAAWLFSRLQPRVAWCVAIVLGAVIVLEGFSPLQTIPFRYDQPDRARLNDWIRNGPPGGVLELPIVGPDTEPFTVLYQYNTLLHRHPVVNGYSGFSYRLQDFLGGPGSPVNDPLAWPGLVEGLRGIGVRYVVLHQSTYAQRRDLGWPDPTPLIAAIESAAGRPGTPFGEAVAWLLDAPRLRIPVDESSLSPVALDERMAAASAMPDRLRFAFDGNIGTKWLSAAPQGGSEWLRLTFAEDLEVGRVVIQTSSGGVGDYPRGLLVESEAADGSRLTLYEGSFLPAMVGGLATGTPAAPAVLDLPSNRTRSLWIRQTGRSAKWQWAVHELQVYKRQASR
jgi:hypothetical protein